MPRIPVRCEPYSSPQRKQRHFKAKRDQILRALGKASYINGSHFAILWVNARGETEHYASELFQSKLGAWFNTDVVAQARQMVLAAGEAQGANLTQIAEKEMEDDEGRIEAEDEDGLDQEDPLTQGSVLTWDSSADAPNERKRSQGQMNGQFGTLDFASTLKQRIQAPGLRRTFSMPNPLHNRAQSVGELPTMKNMHLNANRPAALDMTAIQEDAKFQLPQGPPTSSNPEYRALTVGDNAEVTAFLETRFIQLQQLVCKIVAKAWIKVIEPKKQTRYPYNKGDESKPSWWPEEARHKEPDHLMKPERISLLMTMLRCGKVPTNRLELATAEVAAFIPPDKINLLREIYRVAREEERFRCNEISGETKIYVAATAVANPALDDVNSPISATMRIAEDSIPRSSSMHDTQMDLQRSRSHHTPQFDEQDPFSENTEMQQNYAMLPPQHFYYANTTPAYTDHANSNIMNLPGNINQDGSNVNTAQPLTNLQFQQAQQHQMFLAQQAQVARRESAGDPSRSQVPYVQHSWPQNMEPSWAHDPGLFQQAGMAHHQMHQGQQNMGHAGHAEYYQQGPAMETPAKQTQRGRLDQQSLRSSPYLPTPLRANLEGTFSASRNQGVSFSDYLQSPRTGVPGALNEEDQGPPMNDAFR